MMSTRMPPVTMTCRSSHTAVTETPMFHVKHWYFLNPSNHIQRRNSWPLVNGIRSQPITQMQEMVGESPTKNCDVSRKTSNFPRARQCTNVKSLYKFRQHIRINHERWTPTVADILYQGMGCFTWNISFFTRHTPTGHSVFECFTWNNEPFIDALFFHWDALLEADPFSNQHAGCLNAHGHTRIRHRT